MAHKVHPKIFRLRELKDWESRGFYEKGFDKLLAEDFKIRQFLDKKIGKLAVANIEIERFAGKVNIIIFSARPGLIIGRSGEGAEFLQKLLKEKLLKDKKEEVRLEVREIKTPWISASLSAQWIAGQLEKRMPYRKVLKQALSKIMAVKGVEGAMIQVKGRLNGTEIARAEWLKKGRLPRQTLRADIDYAQGKAYCTYGVIGIKVWIYKGEKFEK